MPRLALFILGFLEKRAIIHHLPRFRVTLKKDKDDFLLQFLAKRLVRKVIIVIEQIF